MIKYFVNTIFLKNQRLDIRLNKLIDTPNNVFVFNTKALIEEFKSLINKSICESDMYPGSISSIIIKLNESACSPHFVKQSV